MKIDMVKFIKFTFIYLFLSFSVFANEANDIKEIKIDGLQRINYDTVLSYGEVNIEVDYTESLSNNIIKKLYDTQLFLNISVNYVDNILTINLVENNLVQSVEINGVKNKKLKQSLFDQLKLTERKSFVEERSSADVLKLSNYLIKNLLDYLNSF